MAATEEPPVSSGPRGRLIAAMIEASDTIGYAETSVEDLLEISGVSRGTFYKYFRNRSDCFQAAVEEAQRIGVGSIAQRPLGEGGPEERFGAALDALAELIVARPAAARMCLIEAYGVGDVTQASSRAAFTEVGRLIQSGLEAVPGRSGLPLELAYGIAGSLYLVLLRRLTAHREDELPDLMPAILEWMLTYEPPSDPLRPPERRGAVVAPTEMPPFAAFDPEQRLIRTFAAVIAERGYGDTRVSDVAAAASISQSTFYAYFDDKEDAMFTALDSSGAQMLSAALPSGRRGRDWPTAVRLGLSAMCGFLAAEPAFAKLRTTGVHTAGPAAIARRDADGQKLLKALIDPSRPGVPEVPPLTMELIVGAIHSVLYHRVWQGVPGGIADSAPLLTYFTLTPLLGPEQACEVAIGGGRGG